jgi:hypothetical protein
VIPEGEPGRAPGRVQRAVGRVATRHQDGILFTGGFVFVLIVIGSAVGAVAAVAALFL